jgi:NADP-dependent 3-hydroxy acid dehydrogenase YdfG
MRSLRNKVVVVTGASSGVGRAAAEAFARKGATVVVVARRPEALDEVVASCRALGADALAAPADVTDAEALDAVARTAVETYGRIDIWVNNAAQMMLSRLEEAPLDDIRAVIDTGVMGYINGCRAALPWIRAQGRGVIINVGSVLDQVPAPYLTPYVITKHASRALASCLRAEVHLDAPKIKVCSVHPGAIDTPFFQHAANYTGREVKALRPTYDPHRVARAIVSCARFPRREVYVGIVPRVGSISYRLAPGITERVTARMVDRGQFADGHAPPTSGNLHEPMVGTAEVTGGWGHGGAKPVLGIGTAAAALALTTAAAIRSRRRDRGRP